MDKPAVPHADSCVHFLRLHRGISVTTGWIDSFYKAICSAGNPIERHRPLSECMCVSPVEMTNLYPWNHRESYYKKFITDYDAPNATLNSASLVQLFVWVDQLNFQELEVVSRFRDPQLQVSEKYAWIYEMDIILYLSGTDWIHCRNWLLLLTPLV